MQTEISNHLINIYSTSDQQSRQISQQALLQLAARPQFISSISNVIINSQYNNIAFLGNIRLAATIYLKQTLTNAKGTIDAKQVILKLYQLIKQPLGLKCKKTLAETIQLVLQKNDKDQTIKKLLINQVAIQLGAFEMNLNQESFEQIQYLIILIKALITQPSQTNKILLVGTIDNVLTIANGFLALKLKPTVQTVQIVKIITEYFEQIFNKNEFYGNNILQQMLLNQKFAQFVLGLFSYPSNTFLIITENNQYSPLQTILNETKSNAFFLVSRSIYHLITLLNEQNVLAKTSPFNNNILQYLETSIIVLQAFVSSNHHFTKFKFETHIKGIDEILKLFLVLINQVQFYNIFSNTKLVLIETLMQIINLSAQQRFSITQEPEQLIQTVKICMGLHSLCDLDQFFNKNQQHTISTRVIASRLIIDMVKNIDGIQNTILLNCISIVHDPTIVNIDQNIKYILLFGIISNHATQNQKTLDGIRLFIETQLEFIYEVNQPTSNHKLYLFLKLVYISIFHSLNFIPHPQQQGHCNSILELIQNIFEGNFQPAIENPALIDVSYDLLQSVVKLDSQYIDNYTLTLLNFFSNKIRGQATTLMLKSFSQLCFQNKALQTMTQTLLQCVSNIVIQIHKAIKSPVVDDHFINQALKTLDTISFIKPVLHGKQWKICFEQNLLTLIEHFNTPLMIQEKVLKIVIRLIKYSQTVEVAELKMLEHGVNFIKTYNKMGPFYDLISLISVYGIQHYQNIAELPAEIAKICMLVLTTSQKLLPADTFKAILSLQSLLYITRKMKTLTPDFIKLVYDTLLSISKQQDLDDLIKSNIVSCFALLVCCQPNPQLFQKILISSQNQIRSVMASKVLIFAFCQLITTLQTNILELFRSVLTQVVYICSHQASIFRADQDTAQDYILQRQFLIQSIFGQKWLNIFIETYNLLKSNETVFNSVINYLDDYEKVQLQKCIKLQYTPHGIRIIRKLK